MVEEKKIDDRTVFACKICGFGYLDRETADRCEEWCRKTGTCSLEITSKTVYIPNPFEKEFENSHTEG
jgi:hypothetical protein